MTQFPTSLPLMSPVLSPAAPAWLGTEAVPQEVIDALLKRTVAPFPLPSPPQPTPGELMQQAAPPAFGYNPMATAQSLYAGDSPAEYVAAAMAARDQAMKGQVPPPMPAWFGPAKPQVDEQGRPITPPMPPPIPPRPSFELTPQQQANITARKQKRAQAQELVTAGRRGQTPSGYRMDIGTPSPVDVAATIGAQGAQVHPQVLGPMLAQQQQAADQNAQASVLVALLRGYGEAGQPIPPTIQRQAMDFLNRGRGLPPTIPSAPGAGQESSAIQRFQTVAAEKGKSEEGDRVLASGDPQQITNFGKRIGLDDQTTNEVVAALEEQPGAVWEMLDRLGKQIPELPLGFGAGPLKQPFVSSFGLLGILPDAPSTLQESGIPTEQLQKVERLLREGSPQEKAWARKWLDGYYSLEQKRGELLRTAGGELP